MRARNKLKPGQLTPSNPSRRDEAVLDASGSRAESCLYSFATDAGAVGTVSCTRQLPAGAIVTDVVIDVLTALTSGGAATVQLKAGTTNLSDAEAYTDLTGTQKLALASSAEAIKIASASELKVVIAGAALTAGKIRYLVKYLLPND